MRRVLLVAVAILADPSGGRAVAPAAKTETVVQMAVQPMGPPTPALKYQLLPELSETSPGNPIQGYLGCFSEQNEFFFGKRSMDFRDNLLAMPLAELRLENLGHYGGAALARADRAARLDRPDWQCLAEIKGDGLHALDRDAVQVRALSYALKVRFRVEIAERRFDDAIATAKTIFAISRHLGEHPSLAANLSGLTTAEFSAIEPLEEMIQQRGCPNLYWALTALPSPLVGIRLGLQSERILLAPQLAALGSKAPMADAELRKAIGQVAMVEQVLGGTETFGEKDVRDWLNARVNNQDYVNSARRRLAGAGMDLDRLKQFPASQVLLLDEKLTYEVRCDDAAKAMLLPYWEAGRLVGRATSGTRQAETSLLSDPSGPIVGARAQARLQQRIGLLRCVEALRMYAANNGGRLPAQLSDVELPVPIDPFTGREFVYLVRGAKATIRGSQPVENENAAAYNCVYEVIVQK